jgi:hypothetical protein
MSSFFTELQQIKEQVARISESVGGVYGDPFNEVATVISVSDPKNLSRVKVEYQDGTTSDWTYVLNSGKGVLSAQVIGSSCLIGKAHGNSNDTFVLGFFNKNPNIGSGGAPLQIPILDEQLGAYEASGDKGTKCNKGNAGRLYLLQNESNQDLVICVRRNNPQEGGEEVWNWKSLTNSKWIEKGFDPGLKGKIASNLSEKKGVPECNEAMDGDVRNFAEDRKFRDFQIKCGRDENGDWNWKPLSATPVFFKTTLPDCTEKFHGMDAILDEGLNSQRICCLRYQGEMKWINAGKREPIQFHREDPPLSKKDFLDSKTDVPAFEDSSSNIPVKPVLDLIASATSPTGTDPKLKQALTAANILPPTFNSSEIYRNISILMIANSIGAESDSIALKLALAISNGGVIDSELQKTLDAAGTTGEIIAQGITTNSLENSYKTVGKNAINSSIRSLAPQTRGVYSAYISGGALAAIDTAALYGMSKLPDEVSKYILPVWEAGKDTIAGKSDAINKIFTSALGLVNTPLTSVINNLISTAGGIGNLPQSLTESVSQALSSGDLGLIAGAISNFSNLPGMPNLGGLSGIPQLATTALELLGEGKNLFALLGNGGLGLDGLLDLAGLNGISSILGAIPGLGSIFSGLGAGGGECPCDPKCRKTEHSEDSDGNVLLEKCGNVVANSHSSYAPDGDPTTNNENTVAKILDLIPTKIGEDLCIPNVSDLTQLIQNVKRLGEMADRLDSAKNADWPELWTEMMYTFETIEKAFKQTDNNITRVESVERKLIDAQYRLINKLMVGNGSFFSKTLLSIVDTSKAIQDTYNYVKRLDATKHGAGVGVTVTDSLSTVFKNITRIAALNSTSKAEANFITSNFLNTADKEWKSMEPGGGLVDITKFILGLIPVDVPLAFDKCLTVRDKNRALNDSISSKINSPLPPEPESLFSGKLPANIASSDNPDINSLLDQIDYQQNRAQTGEAEC